MIGVKFSLKCNVCMCTYGLREGSKTGATAALREAARLDGWTQKNDSDYCAECTLKRKKKKENE